MANLETPDYERARKTLEELRQVAVPVVRFLIEHGMLNSEVRIDSTGVNIFSPSWGAPFTPEDEEEIFQELAFRA